jgi:hypothetical protein
MPYISTYENGVLVGQSEIDMDLQDYKAAKIEELRGSATAAIEQHGIDSITMQNASLGLYDTARTESIRHFIELCRQEFFAKKLLVENAATNDEVSVLAFEVPQLDVPLVTAEQAVSTYFSAYQIAALQELRMALLQANKPLGPKMTAAKNWLESVMLGWALDPTEKPQSDFGAPSGGVTFEQASAEAVASLQEP